MSVKDDFFQNVRREDKGWDDISRQRGEETLVKNLLESLRMSGMKSELLGLAKARYGETRLSFKVFAERFSGFPWTLAYAKPYKLTQRITIPKLFAKAGSNALLDAYVECFGDAAEPMSAMAFPFGGIHRGLVAHNADPVFTTDDDEPRMFWILCTAGSALTVERWDTFVERIKASWI